MRTTFEKISVAAATIAIGAVILACKKGEGSHCIMNKDCKDDLICAHDKTCQTVAGANKVCEADDDCKTRGWCQVYSVTGESSSTCSAKTEDDCKKGPCHDGKGKCRVENGNCVE